MFPPDPLRQKMLFKTEWHSVGVQSPTVGGLAAEMNVAFRDLLKEGYNISQVMPFGDKLSEGDPGMLVIGQRVSSPVADPTPQGVPVPGTNAMQNLDIVYSFVEDGCSKTEKMPSLKEAARVAAADLDASAQAGRRQPISIHVVSTTVYGTGDLHVLRQQMG